MKIHSSNSILSFIFCGRSWFLGQIPRIMGILNVTPDSFSDGGRFDSVDAALEQALTMQEEGADIIDVGGESTRPGAEPVDTEEEMRRVLPIIQVLADNLRVPISIDTRKSSVAAAAIAAGASLINDVSGFHDDPGMWQVMRDTAAGAVIMHMRGTPQTMQSMTQYHDIVNEISDYFRNILSHAANLGIAAERFIIDPGIGFGKTVEQNLQIIAASATFRQRVGRPVLLGPSRKSFIGKLLNQVNPGERDWGTAGAVAAGVMCGADLFRVHNITEIRQIITIASSIKNSGINL